MSLFLASDHFGFPLKVIAEHLSQKGVEFEDLGELRR